MPYEELVFMIRFYYPALLLERALSHRARHILKKLFGVGVVCFAFISILLIVIERFERIGALVPVLRAFGAVSHQTVGLTFLACACWLALFMLEAMFHSFYFEGVGTAPTEVDGGPVPQFEVASIVFNTRSHDVVDGFCTSLPGMRILMRAGISGESVGVFLTHRTGAIQVNILQQAGAKIGTLSQFAAQLMRIDKEFQNFIFSQGISEEDFRSVAMWVERLIHDEKRHERWWSREHLFAYPGIAEGWAYGETYHLDHYSRPISKEDIFARVDEKSPFGKEEADKLEAILGKEKESNALLVGEAGAGGHDIIARIAKRIERGASLPQLSHKAIRLLNHEMLIAAAGEKGKFEREFISIMVQAISAGNIVLVIEDLPAFIRSATSIGADIVSLFDHYLSVGGFQVIAMSGLEEFHQFLERSGGVISRFDTVMIPAVDVGTTLRVLEDRTIELERRHGMFFTYLALKVIAESADQYFPYGVMPDKAVDLLLEVLPEMQQKGLTFVNKNQVLDFVTQKTGIPVGTIGEKEKEKLQNLEAILQRRVIDQQEAVRAVSDALRRVRSGLGSVHRPIGTFLFLGPTGVGKTETAKALAEAYFGEEGKLLRLDMSEYSGADALSRLIGTGAMGARGGTFASMAREHPYGVMLLDEFEKATKDVHNLFLQVFDEGFFSDGLGKRVVVRNMIFIATSNAGSDFIWEAFKRGENVGDLKKQLVDAVIKAGIYKPELLNRFDDIIVFQPLGVETLRKISKLMLGGLVDKLDAKGIRFELTDDLVETLVEQGYDPQFGARPMRRALEQKIEGLIAKKMIAGEIKPGSVFKLSKSDFETAAS